MDPLQADASGEFSLGFVFENIPKSAMVYSQQDGFFYNNYINATWTFDATQLHMDAFPNSGAVSKPDGTVIGHFSVKDGIVTIKWDVEAFLWEIVEGGVEWGTLRVSGEYYKEEGSRPDVDEVKLNGNTVTTLYPNGIRGDVNVEKTYDRFDASTGMMYWDITVSSEDGTYSAVKVTDTMQGAYKSITFTHNGSTITPSQNGNNYTFTLPAMNAGETQKIRVAAKITEADGSYYAGWRKNGVSVESTKMNGEPCEKSQDPVGEDISLPSI